jgi:hypothetical protein
MTNANPPMIVMFTAAQEGDYIPPVIFVDLSSRITRERIKRYANGLKECDVTTAKFGETLLVKGYTKLPTDPDYDEERFTYCSVGIHFWTLTVHNDGRVYYGPEVRDIHPEDLVVTSKERLAQVLHGLSMSSRLSLAERVRYLVRYGRSCGSGPRRCVLGYDPYDNCFGFSVDEWCTVSNSWVAKMCGGLIYDRHSDRYSVHT